MVQRTSSPESPVTVTITPGGNGGVINRRSLGPSSPAQCHSFSITNPNSPISRLLSSGGGRRFSTAEEAESTEYVRYTVQLPATPDRHTFSVAPESVPVHERGYITGTLFSGAFNCVTRSHFIGSSTNSPPVPNHATVLCQMDGCDGEPFFTKAKQYPCDCRYLICKDCYLECNGTEGKCPGCKEPYRVNGEEDPESDAAEGCLPLTSMADFSSGRRLSMMKSMKGPADFDHSRWLFETRGTFGYGNAIWPEDGVGDGGRGGRGVEIPNFSCHRKRPLTRKIGVSRAITSPYR